MTIKIVDFPIKPGDLNHGYVSHYQRVSLGEPGAIHRWVAPLCDDLSSPDKHLPCCVSIAPINGTKKKHH